MKKQIFFFILSLTSNYTKCAEVLDQQVPELLFCKAEEADDLVERLRLCLIASSIQKKLPFGRCYFRDSKGRRFEINYVKSELKKKIIIKEISEHFFDLLSGSGGFYPRYLILHIDKETARKFIRENREYTKDIEVTIEMLNPVDSSSSCSRTPSPKRARRK